ncbi:hypothetical protein B0A54_14708 [Friedmanniomyces endolithicus]|uniref:Rxt3-domain-containing protein n=1 Tax=Friedmanniomyces endolithicus TaxID=329885 RepID=A0A4U0UCU4_9PEZI|nr:hypothetical protein B0A54_14708 [Friedmanniomyces endolithicus]
MSGSIERYSKVSQLTGPPKALEVTAQLADALAPRCSITTMHDGASTTDTSPYSTTVCDYWREYIVAPTASILNSGHPDSALLSESGTSRLQFAPPQNAPGNNNGNGDHAIPQQQQASHHVSSAGPPLPPPPPHHGLGQMYPFDPLRRRSLGGGAGNTPQYVGGPHELPPPPSFPTRNMPPPSPPQMPPPAASAHLASAPRGPPIASPFAGVRDLPGFAPHRPGNGMTITSILGGGSERSINSSPRKMPSIVGNGLERAINSSPNIAGAGLSSSIHAMRPPSPGRARATSMREAVGRREQSPPRGGIFGEPRAQSAFHERTGLDARGREAFASPGAQFQRESPHSFRAFRPDQQESRQIPNGPIILGRPSSQPVELVTARDLDDTIVRRETPPSGQFGGFRHFGEPLRPERVPRHDAHPFPGSVTSQPREVFGSPRMDRDIRYTPGRFQPGPFGTPMREDQAGLFRPVHPQAADAAQESIETQPMHDPRREEPRSSPPVSDLPLYLRGRNSFADRPMTFEEHQRMEAMQRDDQRKGSDGSAARSMPGISPELNRKGRDSPLPQAVQGAQPRFVGLGGNNPGIKMEFGRMFSGLGSGVGSATPVAGQSANVMTTPFRLSPARQYGESEDVPPAEAAFDMTKTGSRARGGRRNGRRSRDEEAIDGDGRMTPDLQRGNKRAKAAHPGHHHHHLLHSHHHHHHHPEAEVQNGSFNMLRFPPNPTPAVAPSHHHHHHTTHAHPAHHHHHHPPKEAVGPRKIATTVVSKALFESVASKPRKHLGSQLYSTEVSQTSNADTTLDAQIKFASKMKPIPLFEGKENCTYTVRVPRFYLASTQHNEPGALEETCKRRQLWGSDVYTDDSDVIAAAVHSGWIKGDFGKLNNDLRDLCDNDSEDEHLHPQPNDPTAETPLTLTSLPAKPAKPPANHDMHITLLLLPALQSYASTMHHHIRSREWGRLHDGMSFAIHRIDFVDEGVSNRYLERGISARKQRMAVEEARRRREAAAGLLMFAHGSGNGVVRVGA